MHVEATRGALLLRFGRRFAVREADHLQEAIHAFTPFSQLTLDFSEVREFEDAAVVPLAKTLGDLVHVAVQIHGLTMHQWRMLAYFGVRRPPPSALESAPVASA